MSQFSESKVRRDGDGKFTEHQTGEAIDVDLDTAPMALIDAVPAGGTLTVGEDEFDGFYSFTEIDVTRNDDGTFAVRASAYTDVKDGLLRAIAQARGFDPEHIDSVDNVEEAVRDIDRWFGDEGLSEDHIAWFEDATGATINRDFEWEDQRFSWNTVLPADASTDQVIDAADEASQTHPDDVNGFYTRMLSEAGGYLARRDAPRS
jgi:hypothetical protein